MKSEGPRVAHYQVDIIQSANYSKWVNPESREFNRMSVLACRWWTGWMSRRRWSEVVSREWRCCWSDLYTTSSLPLK